MPFHSFPPVLCFCFYGSKRGSKHTNITQLSRAHAHAQGQPLRTVTEVSHTGTRAGRVGSLGIPAGCCWRYSASSHGECMCVCLCVCVCVCVCVCICAGVHGCVCLNVYVCILCMDACMLVCMYVCILHVYASCMRAYTRACTQTQVVVDEATPVTSIQMRLHDGKRVHTLVQAHTHMQTRARAHTHTHTSTRTPISTHMCVCVFMHMYTHTYTCNASPLSWPDARARRHPHNAALQPDAHGRRHLLSCGIG